MISIALALVTERRSSFEGNPISSSDGSSEISVKFHYYVEKQTSIAWLDEEGYYTILEDPNVLIPEREFNIQFSSLLIPEESKSHIHTMLADQNIPFTERTKQEISTYALEQAKSCKEKNSSGSLDIYLNIGIFTLELRNTSEETGELLARLMNLNGVERFHLVPASRSSIEALEILKFNHAEEEPSFSTETCMICMDEYVREVHIARLPCSHYFHKECIFNWLEHKNTCPLCRFAMPTEA